MRTKKQLQKKKENAGKIRSIRRLLIECFEALIEEERRLLATEEFELITKL